MYTSEHDGAYLVALPRSAGGVAVRIVYAWSPPSASAARVELGAVKLPGLQINRTEWRVLPPPGYRITSQETRMATRDLARPTPACAHAADVLAAVCTPGGIFVPSLSRSRELSKRALTAGNLNGVGKGLACLLYTSPSPRDRS